MSQLYPLEYMYKKLIIENCTIEITDQCNFNCIHCDHQKKIKGYFMSLKIFKDIIQQLKKLGTFRITITGGEPFEHPMILEIIDFLNRESFFVKVITNGFHITDKQIELLKIIPKLEIIFSLHGTEQIHEKITGIKDSYKKTINNILKLKEGKCKVSIQGCMLKQNFDDLSNFIQLLEILKVSYRLDPYITNMLKNHDMKLFRLSDSQLIKFYKKYKNIATLVEKVIKYKETVRLESCDCGVARSTIAISPYGEIFPCTNIRISAGNIATQSIYEIWMKSPLMLEFRSRIEKPRFKCNSCEMNTLCSQCMAISISEHDDWRLPPLENCRHMSCLKELR